MPTYKDLTHTSSQVDQTIDQFAAHAANAVIHVTEAEKESWNSKADADASYTKAEANALLFDKVDKVAGKQLSTEDFTAADKAKLQSLNNYDDTEVRGLISANADDIESEVSNRTAADAELNSAIGAVANAGAKNCLLLNQSSGATAGVDWTIDQSTGVVTAARSSGTSDSTRLVAEFELKAGTYIFTSYPNASFSTADSFITSGGTTVARDVDGSQNFTLTQDAAVRISCRIRSGLTSAEFKPMIRRAEIEDDTFVPYAPSNRELYEMILALQNGDASLQSMQPTLMSGASTNDEEAKEV